MDLKKTAFHSHHTGLGARMVPFAGYEMPLEYEGVRAEHRRVRESAGVFDVSHMGEIWVRGPGAFDLVQKLTSNDLRRLAPGKVQYSCFPNDTGGIVDDLLVYGFPDQTYLLVVNAANVEKDEAWIRKAAPGYDAEVENASGYTSQLAVQGPEATNLLQALTAVDLSAIPYYHFERGELAGVEDVLLSHTGYTGAGGFELYMNNADASRIWEALFEEGSSMGLKPVGLAARDTLRLEMGYCLYGNDIDETTSPLEAGLGWITQFVDGNPFINRPALEEQKARGVSRRLTGFELTVRGIPRQHYPILDPSGKPVGEVTSGTQSPMTGKGIGMGYVATEFSKPGTGIWIGIRNKTIPATVVRPPFFRADGK